MLQVTDVRCIGANQISTACPNTEGPSWILIKKLFKRQHLSEIVCQPSYLVDVSTYDRRLEIESCLSAEMLSKFIMEVIEV